MLQFQVVGHNQETQQVLEDKTYVQGTSTKGEPLIERQMCVAPVVNIGECRSRLRASAMSQDHEENKRVYILVGSLDTAVPEGVK